MPDMQAMEPKEGGSTWEAWIRSMRETADMDSDKFRAFMRKISGVGGYGEADQLGCGVIGKTREAWGVK